MTRNFTQLITLHCSEPERLIEVLERWDRARATSEITGYMSTRVLADLAHPGDYTIVADFGVIDPDVSPAEEAARNNDRPETQAAAAAITELIDGQPVFRDFDEIYRTDYEH